jgi:hypothetical protein
MSARPLLYHASVNPGTISATCVYIRVQGVLVSAHFEKNYSLVIPCICVIWIEFHSLVHEIECLVVLNGFGEFDCLIEQVAGIGHSTVS